MKTRHHISLIAAALTVLCAGNALAAPAVDANIEFDNTYRSGSKVDNTADEGMSQSGRVELNVSGKAGADMFVAARASLLARKDGTAATDDMWVQIGSARGDVKLGRFEAADLFPLAQDTLINHAGNVYYGNALRGRKDANVFHAAGTMNLGNGLSVELGAIATKSLASASGIRPVLSYAAGPLSARLGFESGHFAPAVVGGPTNKVRGVGATLGYDFGGVKLTGNFASGKTDSALSDNKQRGLAVTAAMGGLVVGAISGKTDQAGGGNEKVQTFYTSYSIPLFDIKGATITPALSSSKAKLSLTGVETKENSLRVRLNYAF
jgi:hypothetical protein